MLNLSPFNLTSSQHKSLLVWAGLASLLIISAWNHAIPPCDTDSCHWGFLGAFTLAGGVAYALMGIKDEVMSVERSLIKTSIDAMPLNDWSRVVSPDNPYMQPAYLRALEDAGTQLRFALSYREDQPVAAATFQVVELAPDTIIQENWRKSVRLLMSGLFFRGPIRVLISGNAFHSWTGSFAHTAQTNPGTMLAELTNKVTAAESDRGGIAFTILRDVELDSDGLEQLQKEGYMALRGVGPTMSVSLDPSWSSSDDYVAAMSKKYRARVRRARKKGVEVTHQDLTLDELLTQKEELAPLLSQVINQASFKLARTGMDDVVALKRHLGDRLVLRVYRLHGEAVCFSCSIVHRERFEALLVGMDYEVNKELCLYQNMLYDFVALGIEEGCSIVHLGRTALEIKSTVGAEPIDLPVLVRHKWSAINPMIRLAIQKVEGVEWTPRNPFKARS